MADEYNSQLATRQTEINEWSYNNKMDTLFVFQLLFISMLIIAILMMFSYNGTIGRPFVWYTFGILLVVDVLVIINRAMYTNSVRDKKQWDKVTFSQDQHLKSPMGKDTAYIAKLDAAYGENGVTLSPATKASIISSTATSSALATQFGVSEKTICAIQSTACACNKCT